MLQPVQLDEDVQRLIAKPVDTGGLDKDVGWRANRFAVEVRDGAVIVHRSGDIAGAEPWASDVEGSIEVHRDVGVVLVRTSDTCIGYDLETDSALGDSFSPTGEVALAAPPSAVTVRALLSELEHVFGPIVGEVRYAAKVQDDEIAFVSSPPCTLDFAWSVAAPLVLRVRMDGIARPITELVPLRRALRTTLLLGG